MVEMVMGVDFVVPADVMLMVVVLNVNVVS